MSFDEFLSRIVIEAVLPGISSVLSFIPAISLLIFALALLRESGIVRSDLAPFFMGFSCSVPAILACNTISDMRTRYITMFLIPYISCSAKLPIYVMLSSIFFPVFPLAAVSSVYLTGTLIVFFSILAAKHLGILQSTDKCSISQSARSRTFGFFNRLRKPSFRTVFDEVKVSCLGFIKKAFTVILVASIIVWLLQNLDSAFHITSNAEESLLAHAGGFIAPVFAPLGFGDWRAAAALLTGISSKESVVSTFAVLAGNSGRSALYTILEEIFTPASAFSFMVFCLLYIPCVATIAAIRNITENIRTTLMILVIQTAFAWCFSFLIFYSIKVII